MINQELVNKMKQDLKTSGYVPTAPANDWRTRVISGMNEAPVQEPSIGEKISGAIDSNPITSTIKNVGIGALKGVQELGKQGEEMLGTVLPKSITPEPVYGKMDTSTEGLAQGVGKFGEKVAEFAVPESKIASTFSEVAPVTLKLVQMAKDFGVSYSQAEGSPLDKAITAGEQTAISGALRLPQEIPAVKKFAFDAMKSLSGYSEEVLNEALKRGKGTVGAVKEGESVLMNAVKNTVTKVQEYATKSIEEGKKIVNDLYAKTQHLKPIGEVGQLIEDAGHSFLGNVSNNLRNNYKIGFTNDGTLLFNRGKLPSNIVSKADQSAIQDAYNMAVEIGNDLNIKNIDAKVERMVTLLKKTPAGSPTGGETKKIIQEMLDNVITHVKEIGTKIPGAEEFTQFGDYLEQSIQSRSMINNMKEIFGSTAHPSPTDISKIEQKMLGLFSEGKMALREGVKETEKIVGGASDIVGSAAGTIVKSTKDIQKGINQATPRGVFLTVVEAIPRAVIRNYIKNGETSVMTQLPKIQKLAKTLRISAQEVVQMVANEINKED